MSKAKKILIGFCILILLSSNFLPVEIGKAREVRHLYKKNFVPGIFRNFGFIGQNNEIISGSGWPQVYDGGYDDVALGIAIDSSGNVVVTGESNDSLSYNFYTIKYDSNGNELWNATYDSGGEDLAMDITIDSNDNIIVVGFTGIFDLIPEGCFHIIKYDKNGKELWNKSYKMGETSIPYAVAVDSEDNIIITGNRLKYGFGGIELPCWTVKCDGKNGNQIWNRTYQVGAQDSGMGIAVDSNDYIIIAGLSGTFSSIACFTVKYDKYGNKLWEKRYAKMAIAYDVAVDSHDNIIVAGYNFSKYYQTDYYISKLNKDGNQIWTKRYDSGKSEAATSVAIDSNNNIIIGGYIFEGGNFWQCTLMYGENGEEKWVKMPSINGAIYDVAIDSSNAIIVTGGIQRETADYYTTKYFDTTPPSIQMKKPRERCLYVFDKEIMSLPSKTIIIGRITIEAVAEDESGIDRIEFYIDDRLKGTVETEPYVWLWDESSFWKHRIKAIAYDNTGTISIDEREVLIFNL